MPTKDSTDIAIIGAGIQGAAIADEAAKLGYRITILEQYTEAGQGSSSKSSKLIHGGLRYLESMQFKLVKECLSERRYLLKQYPDIIKLQKFFIPTYKSTSRSTLVIRIGLSLYALLGKLKSENRFSIINRKQWSQLDGLGTNNLNKVFQYFDAQTDDVKLTQRLIENAQKNGAQIKFSCRLEQCTIQKNQVDITYKNKDNIEHQLSAHYLVNATGPWVNQTAALCKPPLPKPPIELVRGTHIELPYQLMQGIYYLEAPQDRRAVFAIPWKGHTLFGTTEILHEDDPSQCTPTSEEIKYLLSIHNHYFPERQYTSDDILNAWAGLRVLPKTPSSIFKRSRDTFFTQNHPMFPNAFSIYGGKLTNHRITALNLLKLLKPSQLKG